MDVINIILLHVLLVHVGLLVNIIIFLELIQFLGVEVIIVDFRNVRVLPTIRAIHRILDDVGIKPIHRFRILIVVIIQFPAFSSFFVFFGLFTSIPSFSSFLSQSPGRCHFHEILRRSEHLVQIAHHFGLHVVHFLNFIFREEHITHQRIFHIGHTILHFRHLH